MRGQIEKWGSSTAVQIPASTAATAGVHIGDDVNLHLGEGRIVIEPVKPASLDALLAKMAPNTFHDPVDFGPRTGEEFP